MSWLCVIMRRSQMDGRPMQSVPRLPSGGQAGGQSPLFHELDATSVLARCAAPHITPLLAALSMTAAITYHPHQWIVRLDRPYLTRQQQSQLSSLNKWQPLHNASSPAGYMFPQSSGRKQRRAHLIDTAHAQDMGGKPGRQAPHAALQHGCLKAAKREHSTLPIGQLAMCQLRQGCGGF